MKYKKVGCFYLIKSDLKRITKPTFFRFLKYYFIPGTSFKYLVWLRIWMSVKKKKILKLVFGIYSYIKFHRLSYKYGITINTDIEIGEGLKVAHSNGVFIYASKIGKNFTIYQNTTVGANQGGRPVIGDNVTIYANSMVIGNTSIGNNAIIGCLTLANKDVPSDSIVYGIPGKIKEKKDE